MARTDAPQEVVDPVCGEIFPPELATFKSEHEGQTVCFCSVTCKESFDAEPERFPLIDAADEA